MAHKLDRTPTYRHTVEYLGPLARTQLKLAERVIRSRGDRLTNTYPVRMGGRDVLVYGFGDLTIYLEFRHPGVVSLYLVIDSQNLPDWLLYPTGDWFEKIDLD
jgi:hypothetical protein